MEAGGSAQPPTVGSRGPSGRVLAIAATAVLALVAGVIAAAVLVGSRGPQTGLHSTTPSTSPSVEASDGQPSTAASLGSPTVTQVPDGTPDEATRPIFQNEALATVRVNDLNIRAGRSTSARILDNAGIPMQLHAGDHVLVVSNATWAEGRWWLEIGADRVRADQPLYDPLAVIGFVAAGTRAEPWVEEDNAWCPQAPSLATLIELSAVERLGCYSSSPLTFSAFRASVPPDVGFGGDCEPPAKYPAWLVCDNINYNWVNRDGGRLFELLLHFDPATGISPTGLTVEGSPNPQLRIAGHFGDRSAGLCDPMVPTTGSEVLQWGQLTCRTLFVVERVD